MSDVATGTASGGAVKAALRLPFVPALAILVVLVALNGWFEPNSLGYRAVTGLVSTYLALVMLAIAQTWVIMAGDIDLSVGAILSLVNVVVIVLMERWGGGGWTVLAACGVGIATGLACGLFNGFVVAVLRLQAIVATFATAILFTGLALYVLPVAGTPAPAAYWRTYGGRILNIPFVFWVVAALAVVIAVLVRTRLALRLLSVGDDPQAAFQSGLPVTAIRIKGYVLCGLFSAFAALCITGDTASGDPLVGGKMTLYSIAAVVLGGSALAGGSATIVGSLVGAFIIGLINSLVFFVGTPSEWQNLVQGLAILVALMGGVLVGRRVGR